jgi:hypothetical protein
VVDCTWHVSFARDLSNDKVKPHLAVAVLSSTILSDESRSSLRVTITLLLFEVIGHVDWGMRGVYFSFIIDVHLVLLI